MIEIYAVHPFNDPKRIAWSHNLIPNHIFTELVTVDHNYPLTSSKKNESGEGFVNVVLSFTPSTTFFNPECFYPSTPHHYFQFSEVAQSRQRAVSQAVQSSVVTELCTEFPAFDASLVADLLLDNAGDKSATANCLRGMMVEEDPYENGP